MKAGSNLLLLGRVHWMYAVKDTSASLNMLTVLSNYTGTWNTLQTAGSWLLPAGPQEVHTHTADYICCCCLLSGNAGRQASRGALSIPWALTWW